MGKDRSLDDFLASDAAGADAEAPEPAADDGAETPDPVEEPAPTLEIRPAESTMDWTPGGAPCAVCGATVERRWRDEPGLVCLDCKEW